VNVYARDRVESWSINIIGKGENRNQEKGSESSMKEKERNLHCSFPKDTLLRREQA
jgi:hypothetical protein